MNTKKISLLVAVISASIVIGIGAGWLLNDRLQFGSTMPSQKTMTESASPEKKALFYRNPMDASITSPVPLKDNMGMDYIPVYEDAAPKTKTERKIS